MAQIKIPPEELQQKATSFIQKGSSFQSELQSINKSMADILNQSEGQFKSKAVQVNEQVTKALKQAIQKITEFGEDCKKAAQTMKEADQKAASDTRNQS
jgi:WXG100 family type VII secretion target